MEQPNEKQPLPGAPVSGSLQFQDKNILDPSNRLNAFQCWQLAKEENLSDDEYKKLLIDNGIIIKKPSGCPCKLLDKPCQTRCSCTNPFSSSGCLLCASYGSDEQRKAQAEYIASKVLGNDR